MNEVFVLLADKSNNTGYVAKLFAIWRQHPGKVKKYTSILDVDDRRYLDDVALSRSCRVRTNINNDNQDIRISAQIAAETIDRTLRKEGDIYGGLTFVNFNIENLNNNIDGRSADLAMALAFATTVCRIRRGQSFPPIAATGIIRDNGSIGPIGCLANKLAAALNTLPPGGKIFYPQANNNPNDVTPELQQQATVSGIQLIRVTHLHDALDKIGIKLNRIILEPFRGLQEYRYEDATAFFGRLREIHEVRDKLLKPTRANRGMLLILGASGSGKSSLVQAGVVRELERNLPPEKILRWTLLQPRCLQASAQEPTLLWPELIAACGQQYGLGTQIVVPTPSPQSCDTFLDWMENGIQQLQTINNNKQVKYLWIIDQLEELFTLGFSPATQEEFSNVLCRMAKAGQWVILNLRSDFFAQFQKQANLSAWVGDNLYPLQLPDAQAIDQMITEPAWLAECEYELDAERVSLATRLREDLGSDTAALPLLGFTLKELYEGRSGNVLTYDYYNHRLGKIYGAIGKQAQETYKKLSKEAKDTLAQVIRKLTTVADGNGGLVTARTALLADFSLNSAEGEFVDAFTKKRLLIQDGGAGNSTNMSVTVRVAHEALLKYWDLAKQQIQKDSELLPVRKRVEVDAQLWAQEHLPALKSTLLLPHGLRLVQAEELLAEWGYDLDAQVERYIYASIMAEQERQAWEEHAQWKIQEQLKVANHNFGLVLLEKANQALERQEHNQAQVYAINALIKLQPNADDWPDIARINAVFVNSAPLLHYVPKIVPDNKNPLTVSPGGKLLTSVTSIAFRPNKSAVAIGTTVVRLVNLANGTDLRLLNTTNSQITSLTFSPNGRVLAVGSEDKTVYLWDLEADAGVDPILLQHNTAVVSLAFSPDGSRLATGSRKGRVRIWDTTTGLLHGIVNVPINNGVGLGTVSEIYHTGAVTCLAFNNEGSILASGSDNRTIHLWNLNNQTSTILQGHKARVTSLAFNSNGTVLASGSQDKTVRLWNLTKATQQTLITGHTAAVNNVIFSPDGRILASEANDGSVRWWNIDYLWFKTSSDKSLLAVWRNKGSETSSALSLDGNILAVGSEYGNTKLWDLSRNWLTAQLRPSLGYQWTHTREVNIGNLDGHDLVARAERSTIVLWDLTTKVEILLLIGHTYVVESLIFNANEHTLISISRDDAICVWDLTLFLALYRDYLAGHIANGIPKLEWQFGYALDGLKLRSYPYHESNSRGRFQIH